MARFVDTIVPCSAHKAAHPDKYPVKAEARQLYPTLEGIEQRYGPTKVHLQVYDGMPHLSLPCR